jgi:hypothetical protein
MTFHDVDLYLSCQEVIQRMCSSETAIQAKFAKIAAITCPNTTYINVNTFYYNNRFQEDRWFPSISTEVAPYRTNSLYCFTFVCSEERTIESNNANDHLILLRI